jgi:hypothetical protein
VPRNFVPAEIPMEFDSSAMADIDRWVKQRGSQLIFVYGQNDPWTAEPFEPGPGTTDAYWYTVPGANHGANLSQLGEDEAIEAIEAIRRWAGLAPLVPASTVSAPSLQPGQALAVDSATVDAINALLHATPLEDVQPFERLHF